MSNYSSGGRGVKTALAILCVILALVLVLMIGATVWLEYTLGRIERTDDQLQDTMSPSQFSELLNETDPEDPTFTGPDLKDDEVTIPTIPADIIISDEDVVNILLVGQDRRKGQGRQRSDAMILCTINKEKKTLTMTSFMRDLYVYIPGYYNQRLNVPYAKGGFDLLNETLAYNFGVRADHCIEVDFDGFQQAIDLVGGVDISLTAKEAEYLNRRGNWGVDPDTSWQLTEGMNHLTGSQALAYSRIRAIGSDFGRTNRQRKVLTELIDEAKDLSLIQVYQLVDQLIPMITTDMSDKEIIGYLVDLFPLLGDLEIVTQRVPADGMYESARVNKMQVLMPNLEKIRQMLADTIGS